MNNSTDLLSLTNISASELIDRELENDPHIKSPHTRRAYRFDLTKFEEFRAGRQISKRLIESYAAYLQREGRAPKTINRALASVRWWARKLADIVADVSTTDPELQARRAEYVRQATRAASVEDVKGSREKRGRDVAELEVEKLLDACRRAQARARTVAYRDAAAIALAWQTGMRRAEITGLELDDLVEEEKGYSLKVRGKGDKERIVYVYDGAADWLTAWIQLRGAFEGPLFVRVRKGGKVQQEGLTTEALAQRLEYRRRQAGLQKGLTWHDFRRTLAGDLLDEGHDILTVGEIMGHSDPKTTKIYDRRDDHAKRAAVRSRRLPGPG